MNRQSFVSASRRISLLGLLLLAATLFPAASRAADPVRETTSLKFVPASAAFYGSYLRNGEQWNALVKSKAYAKLMSMPGLQMGLEQLKALWEAESPEMAMFKEQLALPENKELLELATDAVSNEVFLYGDSGFATLLDLMNQMNGAIRTAQLEALKSGEDPGEIMAKKLFEFFDKQGDKLKAPDLVIGFKLTDAKKAERQLARLEKLLADALADEPKLKMRLKREKIAGSEFLSFQLDGSLIPWDEIPLDDLGDKKEAIEKVQAKVSKMTLVINLGVRDGYLILSIGDTSEHLAALGKGKLLVDRPEMAPLLKAGDKRFTSFGFVSEEFTRLAAASQAGQFDDLVNLARQGLPLSDLDEDLQAEIIADAEALSADIKKALPKPGATMSYSFLTPRGYESFSYNLGEHKGVDGSKPLTLLDNVGGNPIFFAIGRGKSSAEEYQMLSKWAAKGLYYFEKIGLSELDEEQQETYKKVRKEVEPLLTRVGKAMTDMLGPALADGQSGVVLEAKSTSKAWHAAMPPAAKPLPMLELAVVVGVSDAALLQKAFGEFYAVAQEGLNKLHKALPDDVPEIKLVPPKKKTSTGGTIFYYELPEELGLDKQLAPNAGLSKTVGVLSYSLTQTERLLTKTPPPSAGPLARK